MNERSDIEWIQQLKNQDPAALNDLWHLLFSYAETLAYRYGEDTTHDSASEAYRRLIERGIHQFRFGCSFKGFCRVILGREAMRLLKKKGIHIEVPLDEELFGIEDPTPLPDPAVVQNRIAPCWPRLTKHEMEIMTLLYGKSPATPQEIAERLSITRNYVNVQAYHARRKLRECLEQRGFHSSAEVLS